MSGKNDGFDALPPGDRTVFRPNPGRRQSAPEPPPTPAGRPNDWYGGLGAQQARAESLPPATDLQIDDLVSPNANPVLRAAGPILLLLGSLRVAVLRASLDSLMEQLARAVVFFERDVRSAGLSAEQARTAQYILCAASDDIVLNIPTDDRQGYARYNMQVRFFQDIKGGELFFSELDRAIRDPLANIWVLELIHACLALGFHGKYRVPPNNPGELPLIQRQLYETLRRVKPKTTLDLSPRWQGQSLGRRRWSKVVPTWAVAAISAALMLGLFITLRANLEVNASEVDAALLALHPSDPITIKRRLPAPPPPPPPARLAQIERIRRMLPPGLCMADRGASVAVRTCGVSLFASGSDVVMTKYAPLVRSMADVANSEAKLNPQPSPLWIVGHTDKNKPGKSDRFASNAMLSKARAEAVAVLLKPLLETSDALRTDGKADTDPIDPGDTPQAYAMNRRVEMLIPRNE